MSVPRTTHQENEALTAPLKEFDLAMIPNKGSKQKNSATTRNKNGTNARTRDFPPSTAKNAAVTPSGGGGGGNASVHKNGSSGGDHDPETSTADNGWLAAANTGSAGSGTTTNGQITANGLATTTNGQTNNRSATNGLTTTNEPIVTRTNGQVTSSNDATTSTDGSAREAPPAAAAGLISVKGASFRWTEGGEEDEHAKIFRSLLAETSSAKKLEKVECVCEGVLVDRGWEWVGMTLVGGSRFLRRFFYFSL